MTPPAPLALSGLVRARHVLSMADGVVGDAVWWQEGTVKAVGRAEELERKVPTRVPRFDLPECIVTPGFADGHTHFGLWALSRRRVHLAGAATLAEALRRVASGVREQGWVLGHGWDANRWEAPPDRYSLDGVTSGPAYLESVDLHAAWANSAALAAAGVTRLTQDPPGGRLVRDANGEPTGLLLEHAMQLIHPVLPISDPGDRVSAIKDAQAFAHRVGITGIHNTEGPDMLRAFRTLDARGELRLRVLFHPQVAQLPNLLEHGVRSGQGGDWLVLGGVKLFLDGSLGSRTAWMLEPYEDGRDRGMPLATEEEARRVVRMASAGGLACAVHAIGDAAVRRALDLLEPIAPAAIPHRIEHVQCIHPDDLGRAARAGIVASMQPAHLPADVALTEERWGKRGRGVYAFRSLLREGTVLAFGSDVPVAPLDPRRGVVAAMGRVDADGVFSSGWYSEERLTFPEVVRAFTLGNATAAGMAERQGRLAPGCDADLVAWAVDPAVLRDDPAAFGAARVDLTVAGGEAVYQRT